MICSHEQPAVSSMVKDRSRPLPFPLGGVVSKTPSSSTRAQRLVPMLCRY